MTGGTRPRGMVKPFSGFLVAAVLVVGTNCIGDNSHSVDFLNTTAVPLLVWNGGDAQRSNAQRVGPGETVKNQWVVPHPQNGKLIGEPRQVQASTESGQRVFCHRFSYDELERIAWHIEIAARDDCS